MRRKAIRDIDAALPQQGPQKTARVTLGIAIAHALCKPGERRTTREIAAFCGCHHNAIFGIELKALQKLRKRLIYGRDPALAEFVLAHIPSAKLGARRGQSGRIRPSPAWQTRTDT